MAPQSNGFEMNRVVSMQVGDSPVGLIRIQFQFPEGQMSFSAEPQRGDERENSALAVILSLQQGLEVGRFFHGVMKRVQWRPDGSKQLVPDAIVIPLREVQLPELLSIRAMNSVQ